VCLGIGRVEAERFAEAIDRGRCLSASLEERAEIAVQFGVVRAAGKRLAALADRLLGVSLFVQDRAEQRPRFDEARAQLEGLLKIAACFLGAMQVGGVQGKSPEEAVKFLDSKAKEASDLESKLKREDSALETRQKALLQKEKAIQLKDSEIRLKSEQLDVSKATKAPERITPDTSPSKAASKTPPPSTTNSFPSCEPCSSTATPSASNTP